MNNEIYVSGRTVKRPFWTRVRDVFYPDGHWFHIKIIAGKEEIEVKQRAGLGILWTGYSYPRSSVTKVIE